MNKLDTLEYLVLKGLYSTDIDNLIDNLIITQLIEISQLKLISNIKRRHTLLIIPIYLKRIVNHA